MLKTASCCWGNVSHLMLDYHDAQWGVPVHDDRLLFEFLILEGAQAGLAWETVLKKRDNYRKAFHNFNAPKIARYTSKDVQRLLADPGIIRNRLKINAAISNARAFLQTQRDFGSFDAYIWQFVAGSPINHRLKSFKDIPPQTPQSDAMSKDLKKRGFKFVGSTICYAFMQAAGLVNDHLASCPRRKQILSGSL